MKKLSSTNYQLLRLVLANFLFLFFFLLSVHLVYASSVVAYGTYSGTSAIQLAGTGGNGDHVCNAGTFLNTVDVGTFGSTTLSLRKLNSNSSSYNIEVSINSTTFDGTRYVPTFTELVTPIALPINSISTTQSNYNFDFSSQNVSIADNTHYAVVVCTTAPLLTSDNDTTYNYVLNPGVDSNANSFRTDSSLSWTYSGGSSYHGAFDVRAEINVNQPDVECWNTCIQGATSDIFEYGTTCGSGIAVDYPNSSEPTCDVECYSCAGEILTGHLFETGTTCGSGDAVDYPESTEPDSCENVLCYQSCLDGAGIYEGDYLTECGVDAALDYPLIDEPYCPSVLCFSSCDEGLSYDVFDPGTTCGSGDAVDYPLGSRPYCSDYYSYACNEYYFNLCSDEVSCEALGPDYIFGSAGCSFMPDGLAGYSTDVDALNALINQNAQIQSQLLAQGNLQSFTYRMILWILFFMMIMIVLLRVYRFLFPKKDWK